MNKKSFLPGRLLRLITLVGPGFFLIGFSIGTGSVVSMASAGSRYGMTFLWALFLSCVFSYVMMEAFGRYTMVTGKSAMYSIRQFPFMGKHIAIVTMIGLVIVEVMALAGIMGIMSDLISEWTGMLFANNGLKPLWIALAMIIVVFLLISIGKYQFFEKVLIFFVSIMGISFILTMFMVIPSPVEIIKGSLPSIPKEANASMIIGALVGTTLTAPTYVTRSILVQQKGWTVEHFKLGRIDSFVAAFLMFIISMAVMACAAGTLFLIDKPVEDVITMIVLLEPLAGRFAISIFVVGILGAGFSSVIPIAMLAPLLIADYRGVPVNMKSTGFRVLCGIALLFGLIVPVFHARPVLVMVMTQCFQIFILPLITVSIIYLLNKKEIMGQYKAGFWLNFGCVATLVFAVIISYQSMLGLIHYFGELL
ncbi:Nramp family divalent metal transporter [Candidatus Latescibacterota bacterium]